MDIVAAVLFAAALLHTFSTKFFERLAHLRPRHAGLWHLLGEVECVFGLWAAAAFALIAAHGGLKEALRYIESRDFTEPAFVFVAMVIAATRPVIRAAEALLALAARVLPLPRNTALFFAVMSIGPLFGSFITEPAAMTLTALILRDRFLGPALTQKAKYAIVGTLFVNVSIGGALTPYAAPPILMVAATWNWGFGHVASLFGIRAAIALFLNAAVLTLILRRQLAAIAADDAPAAPPIPLVVSVIHLAFLAAVVFFNHYPAVFLGLFLFFLGYTEAYERHQSPLILREALLVGFFLAGLVTLGGLQSWWLQPLLQGLDGTVLFLGATALTAITDNAALTYLGSLVQGVGDEFKYALVAGAITGGGLTVIANAPNPAGYALLRGKFEDASIGAGPLFLAAVPPTLVALALFWGDRAMRAILGWPA
jgi:Putative Na+/H+ antiporter